MLSRFGIFFGALALLQILGGHQSLVLDTDKWLVVLTGCGHAGLINILTYARQAVRPGTGLRGLSTDLGYDDVEIRHPRPRSGVNAVGWINPPYGTVFQGNSLAVITLALLLIRPPPGEYTNISA
jgi:hypothetical protein